MVEHQKHPMTSGEWLVGCTLSMVHWGRVLVQLVNLDTTPILLHTHPILADLHAVLCHYIRSLLEELDIPFKEFSLPQQRLFHQLLEKHLLMFVTSPEDYGFN